MPTKLLYSEYVIACVKMISAVTVFILSDYCDFKTALECSPVARWRQCLGNVVVVVNPQCLRTCEVYSKLTVVSLSKVCGDKSAPNLRTDKRL